MERYVEKMRKRKLQGGKKTIAGQKRSSDAPNDGVSPRGGPLGPVNINSASKAIAQRYLLHVTSDFANIAVLRICGTSVVVCSVVVFVSTGDCCLYAITLVLHYAVRVT
jgi:hypothetical protein